MSINEERTINILKVYQYLLGSKLIEDNADFCRQVGLTETQFGRIQAGEIFFPPDNEVKLVGRFYVNVNFIYHGRGKMLWANDPVKNIFVVDKAVKRDKMKMKTIEMAPKKRLLPIKTSKGVFIMPNKSNKHTRSKLIS